MNPKILEKIRAVAILLRWFRSYLLISAQNHIRPYLDQPYQLALKLMDGCNSSKYGSMEESAVAAKVSKNTARQVLSVLREMGWSG